MEWTKVLKDDGCPRDVSYARIFAVEVRVRYHSTGRFHWTAYDHVHRSLPMWSEDALPTEEGARRDAERAVERYLAGQLRDSLTPDEMDH